MNSEELRSLPVSWIGEVPRYSFQWEFITIVGGVAPNGVIMIEHMTDGLWP